MDRECFDAFHCCLQVALKCKNLDDNVLLFFDTRDFSFCMLQPALSFPPIPLPALYFIFFVKLESVLLFLFVCLFFW